ncbi:MAG: carboxypeptidase-like regulatory domain-containing protein [Bacteroidia bacterium]
MKRYFLFSIFYFLFSIGALAQSLDNSNLVQISGVVLTSDSLDKVSFANIIAKNSRHGTISDYFGYFSFVAQKGDTIQFSALGFRKAYFVIPDTLSSNKYSLIKIMEPEIYELDEAIIFPWPSREQFKQAFLNLQIPDDDLAIANKNLSKEEMMRLYYAVGMDEGMNYKNYIKGKTDQLYYAGQLPPQNILNPIAWAKFIQAWKNGDFKKKQ